MNLMVVALLGSLCLGQVSVVPRPSGIRLTEGRFVLGPDTQIVTDPQTDRLGQTLAAYLRPATGLALPVVKSSGGDHAIVLSLDASLVDLGPEGYRVSVDPNRVQIKALTQAGVFYGIQTLRQLLPPAIFSGKPVSGVEWVIPSVQIEDRPRFSWRGMHLDVARHFMPIEFIYKYIDLLAIHKMNRFHWHLTDDQGWRIEIKKYPRLTQVGAWRKETLIGRPSKQMQFDGRPHGGFYTQEQIRQVVRYAKERFVTVVPEIEMPGHCQAALAAYPELGVTGRQVEVMTYWGVSEDIMNPNEFTIRFMQDVLSEVMKLFDSPFIHIGGDEVPKAQWKASPEVQAMIKELGLQDEHELQSWFIRRMDSFLASYGRRLIGWDEILEGGLAPGATVMSWRGEAGGIAAAKADHDVVMAPNSHTYFDYYQADPNTEPLAIGGYLPLEKVYSYDPVPSSLTQDQARHILGVQGQVWTEYIPEPNKVEYMAFPRACALAEVAWTQRELKDIEDFKSRLRVHLQRLDAIGVNYRPIR
ncbi:MAG: beta-N-acetylhexosaminidase [Sedimentisphaerales bacterium]|nr:beta-N-acetylhexosaminidase [Sedimentisphaerales bacterium]